MAGSAGGDGDPEFQIAPMIDVLLVLLIFFMSIASSAVNRYDPGVSLPTAADAGRKDDSQAECVVNVHWDEGSRTAGWVMDEVPVDRDQMGGMLGARARANPGLRVLVRADSAAHARAVSAVVAAAAEAGISEVHFAVTSP